MSCTQSRVLEVNQVNLIINNSINALINNDYPVFSSQLSSNMLNVFPKSSFDELSNLLINNCGSLLTLGNPIISQEQGYTIFSYNSTFSKDNITITASFKDSYLIEGLYFDSYKLRSLS